MVRASKRKLYVAAAVAMIPLTDASAATTGWNQPAAGTHDLLNPANWADSDGVAGPSAGDVNFIWDSSHTLTGIQTLTLGSSPVLSGGMTFAYQGNFATTIIGEGGDRNITLGGDVQHNTGSLLTLIVGSFTTDKRVVVNLGGQTRTFDIVGNGNRVLNLRNGLVGTSTTDGVVKVGVGQLQFEAASTYSGGTTVHAGTLWLGSSGKIENSDAVINAGGTIRFDSSGSGSTSFTRVKSLRLNGGNITGTQSSSTSQNTNDLMNALTIGGGTATITMTPTTATDPDRHMRMTASSLTREAGGVVHFRGSNLGVNPLADNAAGASSFVITSAPTLFGTGTAGTTIAILKGAYASTAANGIGDGFVTYDAAYGVRVLNPTAEYKSSLTDDPTALDNVRLTVAGSTTTLSAATTTTIQSLALVTSGAVGNAGITVSGGSGATLKLSGGMLLATQGLSAAGTASDYITINVPKIDLSGAEGIFIGNTANVSNGTTGALVQIDSEITNDGGNGVTFGGTGTIRVAGAVQSTYTGNTYASGGTVWLNKSISNIAIPGHLVVSSGTLLNTGNQLPNESDVTVNGGTYLQKSSPTNVGSGASETFRDLTMNGGTAQFGTDGTSSGTTSLRHGTTNGGSWVVTKGHNLSMTGSLTLNGGTLRVDRANGVNVNNTFMSVAGNVAIGNTAIGVFRPITIVGGSATGINGGRLTLAGDLTFTGNTNTNTVFIDATAPGTGGGNASLALTGTRTFNIGNGAAATDLAIAPVIINGASAGGIIKTGQGRLALNAINTYSGGTAVNEGVLSVNGTLGSGAVSVTGANTVLELNALGSINNNAAFSIGSGGLAALNFTGAETVGPLTLGNQTFLSGTFDASTPGGYFSGAGSIVATPEPGALSLLVLAGCGVLTRRRRSNG